MSLSPEETLTWPAPGGPTRPSVPGVATDSAAVLATKLFIPSLGRRSIQRPRLSGLLGSAMGARLTLVVAPAGWGKSTLLAQWLGEAGAPRGRPSPGAPHGGRTPLLR